MNIFDLQATISLNADSLLSGLEEAQTSFEGLNDSVSDTARDISSAFSQLEQPISNASTMLADVGEAAGDAASGMDEIEGSVDGASSGLDEISESASNAGGELSEAGNAAASAGNDAENSAPKWGSLKDALGGVASAAGLITAGLGGVAVGAFKVASDAAYAADDLNTLSKQTGISTEDLQKFQYASDLIDVSMDTFTGSLTKLTRNMNSASKGTGTAGEAFDALGISITEADGSLRNNQEVFYDVIDALADVENYIERDAMAMEIFGRSAQDLNPLILGGSESLKELGKQAEDAGLILSQDSLDGLNELSDALDRAKATASSFSNVLGTAFAPSIAEAVESVTGFAQEISGAFSEGFDTGGLEGALSAVGDVISGKISELTGDIGPLEEALQTASSAVQGFLDSFAESDAADAIADVGEKAKSFFGAFTAAAGDTIGAVAGSVKEFLNSFGESDVGQIIGDIAEKAAELFGNFLIAGESVIKGVASGIQKFFDVFNESAAVDAIESVAGVIADLFAPFSDALGAAIKSAGEGLGTVASKVGELAGHLANGIAETVKDLADSFEKWAPWVAAVAGGLIAMQIVSTVSTGFILLKSALVSGELAAKAMAAAQGVLNAVMNANPIMLVVTAIGALAAGLVTAYAVNEDFRNSVDALWAAFSEGAKAAVDAVGQFCTEWIPEKFDSMLLWFKEFPSKFWEVGKGIVDGIKKGLSDSWDAFKNWVTSLLDGLVDSVLGFFGINSPSTVFAGIGKNLVKGMEVGWGREFGTLEVQVENDLEGLSETVQAKFSDSAIGRSSAAGISSNMALYGSRNGDPIEINLVLDGDIAARALYDPLRRTTTQKGNGKEVAYA